MSMNYEFSSSELSYEILEKLIPLIPLFEDKDLYVLLVTISKIMKGKDENKILFYETSPNHFDKLLEKVLATPHKKDIVLAVMLILKEILILFCTSISNAYKYEFSLNNSNQIVRSHKNEGNEFSSSERRKSPASRISCIYQDISNDSKLSELIEKFLIMLTNEI